MMSHLKKIFIIAGEASGDLHGAKLIRDIKSLDPNIQFIGMGGPSMKQAGAELLVDATQLSAIGFFEIVSKIKQNIAAFRKLRAHIKKEQPDLIILIDYPEFNLRFARSAKKFNIKVLYYISPQIWAWRQKRINIIKKYVDLMAVVFPFEVDFYRRANVPVKFVGHPLAGHVKTSMSTLDARHLFEISENSRIIGLMPGSRQSEIKYIFPVMIETASRLKEFDPNIQFILPLAPTLSKEDFDPYLEKSNLNIKIVTRDLYDAMQMCDAIIVASGTATLEITLLGIPMVIIYKGSKLSHAIVKKLVKIPHVGLCNIMANKKIIAEFIQEEATASNIANEVVQILSHEQYAAEIKHQLYEVTSQLRNEKNIEQLSKIVIHLLGE